MNEMSKNSIKLLSGTTTYNIHQPRVAFVIALTLMVAGITACGSNRGAIANPTNSAADTGITTANTTTPNADAFPNQPLSPSPTRTQATNETTLTPQPLRARTNGEIVINVALPEGYHLNEEAPQHYEAIVTSGNEHLTFARGEQTIARTSKSLELPLRLPLNTRTAGKANVRVSFKVFYCRYEAGGSCRVKTLTWNLPIDVTMQEDAPHVISAQSEITL